MPRASYEKTINWLAQQPSDGPEWSVMITTVAAIWGYDVERVERDILRIREQSNR